MRQETVRLAPKGHSWSRGQAEQRGSAKLHRVWAWSLTREWRSSSMAASEEGAPGAWALFSDADTGFRQRPCQQKVNADVHGGGADGRVFLRVLVWKTRRTCLFATPMNPWGAIKASADRAYSHLAEPPQTPGGCSFSVLPRYGVRIGASKFDDNQTDAGRRCSPAWDMRRS